MAVLVPTVPTETEIAREIGVVCAADFPRTSAGLLSACNTAVAEGRELIVTDDYELGSTVSLPSNLTMRGVGNIPPVIRYDGSASADCLKITDVSNITLENLTVDDGEDNGHASGQCIEVSGSTNVNLRRIKTIGAADQSIIVWNNSSYVRIEDCNISDNPNQEGIAIKAASFVYVTNCVISNNDGFGIFVENAASNIFIKDNTLSNNYIEGIGIRYDVTNGQIHGNYVYGGGDNGISITGLGFSVIGNHVFNPAFHGICAFGSLNTITGNHLYNCGQAGAGYGGVAVSPGFGGVGVGNVIGGNIIIDNQASPTMSYGVKLNTDTYTTWANGQTITVAGGSTTYRKYLNNLYVALNSGTTATGSEPVHTSGSSTGADGIGWTYIATTTALIDFCATDNKVGHNTIRGAITEDYYMSNVTHYNSIYGHDFIRLSARNGAESSYNYTDIYSYAGSPEGNLSAAPGSIVLRRNGGSGNAPRVGYGKNSGTGTSGWGHFQLNEPTTTAARPTLAAADAGYNQFDTTIAIPIWWTGAAWVNSIGVAV